MSSKAGIRCVLPFTGSAIWWKLQRKPQDRQKVTAAYCRVYGVIHFTSPAGWLPVHRDQLRAQRSLTSMGKLYLLPVQHSCKTWQSSSTKLFSHSTNWGPNKTAGSHLELPSMQSNNEVYAVVIKRWLQIMPTIYRHTCIYGPMHSLLCTEKLQQKLGLGQHHTADCLYTVLQKSQSTLKHCLSISGVIRM